MPNGRTHDSITLWALPVIAGLTFWYSHNSGITLVISAGFLLGGLMFGPDLDIYSVQYQRWGIFRWIWLPYQKSLRHRSFLSHGPIIGTTLRVVYFTAIIALCGFFLLFVSDRLGVVVLNWQALGKGVAHPLRRYTMEFLTLFLGLELGAMSHYLSDWSGSAYKRFKKYGVKGLIPRVKMKKRKATKSRSRSQPKPKARKSQIRK
jgi:uncharacterized metal-binding protein